MKVTTLTSTFGFRPQNWEFSFSNTFKKLRAKFSLLLDSLPISYPDTRFRASAFKFSWAKLRPNKQLSKLGIIALVVILLSVLGIFLATRKGGVSLGTSHKDLNETYSVLARDKNGNSLNKYVSFKVTSVEKVGTVLVQGQRLKARDGKQFLLVNFETDNAGKVIFYLNPTDLVRYLRDDGKKFAPTVYQGILEVRPESTKNSNIGFVITPKDSTFKLEVGDLESSKKTLEIKF